MRKTILTTLSLSLLVAGSAGLQAAGTNDSMTNLFNALNKIMLGKSDPKSGIPAATLIMAVPGLPIPAAGLSSTDSGDQVFLNNTLDTIPANSSYYIGSGRTYSNVYADILNHSAVQHASYTDDELQRIDALKTDLDQTGPMFNKFLEKEKTYFDLIDALNVKLASGGKAGKMDNANIVNALSDWQVAGNMQTIKQDKVDFNTLMNRGSATWWSDLLDTMTARQADTTTPLVLTYPKPENWGANCTWTTFHWAAASSSSSSSDNSQSAQAAASYSSGGLHVGVNAGWSKDDAKSAADDQSTVIDVDLARVLIYRPWLDSNVFSSTAWDYQGTLLAKDHPLFSDGKGLSTNNGIMPVMIDQIWLARNLKIHGKWTKQAAEAMKSDTNVSVHVSYGPFSGSASYSKHDQSASESKQSGDTGIGADGIQVVAFICTTVPKCPQFTPSKDPTATAPKIIIKM